MLSRRPDHDDGSGDNDQIVALPDTVFAKAISTVALDEMIRLRQRFNRKQLDNWHNKYHLMEKEGGAWYKGTVLVMTREEGDRKVLLEGYYDALTARYPGATKTLLALS